jgi:hypothetical protein
VCAKVQKSIIGMIDFGGKWKREKRGEMEGGVI